MYKEFRNAKKNPRFLTDFYYKSVVLLNLSNNFVNVYNGI